MNETRHLTTRRGFVAAFGFGGASLYALWAAYGAAPGPMALLGRTAAGALPASVGHGGAHAEADAGPTADEFRRIVSDFIARHEAPDGAVHPRRPDEGAPAVHHDPHAGHGDHAMAEPPAHAAAGDEPVDVYLLAEKWSYEPAHLRLDAGTRYRFRMMAADIAHGASIQFGRGGRMVRLRPNSVAELEAVFTRPGSFLVYCTVYCGQAHDFMQARIDVV